MLKRFSSLVLALVIGGSVLAGTVQLSNEHICKMAGMEMTAGMELMPGHGADAGGMEMMSGMELMPGHGADAGGMEMMLGMELMPEHGADAGGMELMPGHGADAGGVELMPGIQMMPGMETMPCCKKHKTQSVSSESSSREPCCVTIPQETGSSGTTFNLRSPSFSVAVFHPAVAQSPLAAPKPYECSYSTEVFLPNLQASYIRNLSLLI